MPDSAWYLQPERWWGGRVGREAVKQERCGSRWPRCQLPALPPGCDVMIGGWGSSLGATDPVAHNAECHPWCCRVPPPMVLHRMTSLVLHQKLLRISQIIWNTHHILCTERFLYLFHPTIYANRLCSISINTISSTTDYLVTAWIDRLSCHKYLATDFPQNAVPEFHFGFSYHLKFKVCVLIVHVIIAIWLI